MRSDRYSYVFMGLSITSSWGNGHATTYRALVKQLARRGHDVLFLERDLWFYEQNRDMPRPPYGRVELYKSIDDLVTRFEGAVRQADMVVVGSYVPEGVLVGEWALATARKTAFYDIDTPVTLDKLERGDEEYLAATQIPRYDLYLSFTGGPTLERLSRRFGAPRPRPLYCSVDPEQYYPERADKRFELGYLGTFSEDRQGTLERLLLTPARRFPQGHFAVAGPQYPKGIAWPANVMRTDHVPPGEHRAFYNAQRYTLNVTRRAMIEAGYSPSVRLFEAAAAGVPIISDEWPGLTSFFEPGREILVARSPDDTLRILRDIPERERVAIAERARERVLSEHTAAHRARALEAYTRELFDEEESPPALCS